MVLEFCNRINCPPILVSDSWVRKLTGKPGGATPPDCEFEARRIHSFRYETVSLLLAASSKAIRIHSDRLPRDLAIAACISLLSSGESLAWMRIPRSFDFGTFGLPILVPIKTLRITKIIVDRI